MATEVGEFVVGAWLREIAECDFVNYNVRPRVGGLAGMAELDVVGFDFPRSTVYLCEVATHLRGLNYGSYDRSIEKVAAKFRSQQGYAERYLGDFRNHRFMLWSPRIPEGALLKGLSDLDGLELIVNKNYSEKVAELRARAKAHQGDIGNPFFRALQILEHLR